MTPAEEHNTAFVLNAFDILFNKRDYAAAEGFWSPDYIQHSAHIEPGREGMFALTKSLPADLRYENSLAVANGPLRPPTELPTPEHRPPTQRRLARRAETGVSRGIDPAQCRQAGTGKRAGRPAARAVLTGGVEATAGSSAAASVARAMGTAGDAGHAAGRSPRGALGRCGPRRWHYRCPRQLAMGRKPITAGALRPCEPGRPTGGARPNPRAGPGVCHRAAAGHRSLGRNAFVGLVVPSDGEAQTDAGSGEALPIHHQLEHLVRRSVPPSMRSMTTPHAIMY